MKALVIEKKELKLKDIPKPKPSQNEALVKVLKAGICNTDLELVKGYMNFEGVPGHEFVGRIVKAPEKSWMNKRVVGEINIACRKCEFCRKGAERHCLRRDVLGIRNKDGAFAEYLTLPLRNLHVLHQSISDKEAVFIEPLAAALEILEQIKIGNEESILVLGDGKLGLLISQVMKLRTEKVYCLGRHERKLDILREKKIKTYKPGERIKQKFDVVIEATGNKDALREALFYVKPIGKIVLKSTYEGEASLDISKIVVDEIQVIGSRCGPFLKAIDMLKSDLVMVEEMVDGVYPLERAEEAFSFAQKPGIMKVLFSL